MGSSGSRSTSYRARADELDKVHLADVLARPHGPIGRAHLWDDGARVDLYRRRRLDGDSARDAELCSVGRINEGSGGAKAAAVQMAASDRATIARCVGAERAELNSHPRERHVAALLRVKPR